jgi:hypothetical protein
MTAKGSGRPRRRAARTKRYGAKCATQTDLEATFEGATVGSFLCVVLKFVTEHPIMTLHSQ